MYEVLSGREYGPRLISLARSAKRSIRIVVYEWRWYSSDPGSLIQKWNMELVGAKRRGLDVSGFVSFGHVPAPFEECGVPVYLLNVRNIMHAKMVIFDDEIAVIGSHNFTKNAFELNHELSVVFDEPAAVARCIDFYSSFRR